jgi:SAM-dependent methyltransferase
MQNVSTEWELEYKAGGAIWGEAPSELAKITADYLLNNGINGAPWSMLDIGCGYGRDEVHLCSHLNCLIRAIDTSSAAIEIARKTIQRYGYAGKVDFQCENFFDLNLIKSYDVVFVSNLYHLLQKEDRNIMRDKLCMTLKPGGFLFLNALSIHDGEEYGKGTAVLGEEHSFQGQKYFHFSSQEELSIDFDFLQIHKLYEHQYIEYRTDRNHNHVTWILIGQI